MTEVAAELEQSASVAITGSYIETKVVAVAASDRCRIVVRETR